MYSLQLLKKRFRVGKTYNPGPDLKKVHPLGLVAPNVAGLGNVLEIIEAKNNELKRKNDAKYQGRSLKGRDEAPAGSSGDKKVAGDGEDVECETESDAKTCKPKVCCQSLTNLILPNIAALMDCGV